MPRPKIISKQENMLLIAIIALALELPEDLTFYTETIGELRRKHFKVRGRTRQTRLKGFQDGHQITANPDRYKR